MRPISSGRALLFAAGPTDIFLRNRAVNSSPHVTAHSANSNGAASCSQTSIFQPNKTNSSSGQYTIISLKSNYLLTILFETKYFETIIVYPRNMLHTRRTHYVLS